MKKKAVIVVGVLLLALTGMAVAGGVFCPSAAERANATTMEMLKKQIQDFERSKKMLTAGRELSATPAGSVEHEEKLNALIELFDPETRAQIKALPREEDRVDAMYIKIKEEGDAKEKYIAREKAKERLCWCLTFGRYDLTYR